MLSVHNLRVLYHDVQLVLRGLSLAVPEGQVVALLGTNGAGKTTTLKAVAGLLPLEEGKIDSGTISFRDQRIDRLDPEAVVALGIALVPQGRGIFARLTVNENLLAGAYLRRDREVRRDLEQVWSYFPVLQEFGAKQAGYLSGGQQQMLAIGRALLSRPRLLILDEPSLGLSVQLQAEIFALVRRLNRERSLTILLVEQNALQALAVADHAYVMENGRIVAAGPAQKLQQNADLMEFYLGMAGQGERRRYNEVKSYRRRKRWLS